MKGNKNDGCKMCLNYESVKRRHKNMGLTEKWRIKKGHFLKWKKKKILRGKARKCLW